GKWHRHCNAAAAHLSLCGEAAPLPARPACHDATAPQCGGVIWPSQIWGRTVIHACYLPSPWGCSRRVSRRRSCNRSSFIEHDDVQMTLSNIRLAGTALGAATIFAAPSLAASTSQAEPDALKAQIEALQRKVDDVQIQHGTAIKSLEERKSDVEVSLKD